MSLQVWLPLNREEIKNQGLANVTITNSGATYTSTEGKISGSYYFNGSSRIQTTLPSAMTTIKNTTVAAWVKSTSSTLALGGISHDSTPDYYAPGCTLYSSGWQTGTGSSWAYVSGGTVANTSVWHHVACVIDDTNVTTYLDGVQVIQKTLASWGMTSFDLGEGHFIEIGSDFPGGNEYLTGYINDFRIYDNALSAEEVKKLSQGLILHYPLNRRELGQENLASQYVMPGGNSPGTTSTAGRTNYYGDYGIIIPATENADTYFSIWYSEPLENGVAYTLSAEVSGLLNGSYYNFPLFAQNNTSMGIIQFNHNGLNKLTFTMNYTGTITTATVGGKTYYRMFMDDNGRAIASGQGAITIKNIKLEKSSIATPWCPNSADVLATTIGLNDNIEYDTSGFSNHGTRYGTFTYSSDTPKYHVSTYASGSATTYLEGPVLPAEAKTVSLWIKANKSSNGAIFNDKTSGLQIGLLNSLLYMVANVSTAGFTTTHWVDGEWNHVVAVNNDGTRSLYVNGQAETQSGAANYYIHNADNCWLWNRYYNNNYPFTGNLSDLRVYATALSASDVLELYNNKNF